MRLSFSSLAAYSAIGCIACAEVAEARRKYGFGRRCVMSSAAARLRSGVLHLRDVVGDRQQLEGGERPEDDVDLVALDQLLHLGLGAGRAAAGVGGEELHLAAGHRVVLFLQKREDALLHLDAALGERAGLHGQQAELEGRGLRVDRGRVQRGDAGAGGQHALEYGSAFDRHWHSLPGW